MIRHRFVLACPLVTTLLFGGVHRSLAQVSYSIADSTHLQDFNSLPTTPTNTNIQTASGGYTSGWKDNTPTVSGTSVGLTGWYLWHPTDLTGGEGGTNGHQRFRVNNGTVTTGSFHAFGASNNTDRALGDIGSATLAGTNEAIYMGLRLVNNTSQTLNGFSILFDGEQWRRSGAGAETMTLSYSLGATESNWQNSATSFTSLPSANFTSPITTGTGGLDGNAAANRVADISAYVVNNFSWAPGAELWLRWADIQRSTDDEGLAIDNVRFTAGNSIVDLNDIYSVASGSASSAATWSNSLAPLSGKTYRVVSGHTVSVDSAFPGILLRANSGGTINFGNAGSGVDIRQLIVDAGGSLTKTATGNFSLGNPAAAALGILQMDGNATLPISAGADFTLAMTLKGAGSIDFNSSAGSRLILPDAAQHTGTIRFNGSGDQVRIEGTNAKGFGTLEMNSIGANRLYYNPGQQADIGTVIFNQPGTIDNASTVTSPTARRLHGPSYLIANAAVNMDLTKGFPNDSSPTDERRLNIGGTDGTGAGALSGSGNITVNGTASDYSNGSTITLNEFEIGQSDEPASRPVSTYSGAISGNNYVNFEIRNSVPNGKFVMNSHSRLEMGHQVVLSAFNTEFGEVVVNDGGALEVGFEQQSATGVPGHHAHQLHLVTSGGRNGSLTMNGDTSSVIMQINGTTAGTFDTIVADGNIHLDGVLNVLVNPLASTGTNPIWTPALGETFDIMTIAVSSPPGDYNKNGTVGPEDYDTWRAAFGSSNAAADGNGNGVVDAADFALWRKNLGQSGAAAGLITGAFDSLNVTDSNGALGGIYAFQVNVTSTKVQLVVVAAGLGAGATIPEPTGIALAGVCLMLVTIVRPSRKRG